MKYIPLSGVLKAFHGGAHANFSSYVAYHFPAFCLFISACESLYAAFVLLYFQLRDTLPTLRVPMALLESFSIIVLITLYYNIIFPWLYFLLDGKLF